MKSSMPNFLAVSNKSFEKSANELVGVDLFLINLYFITLLLFLSSSFSGLHNFRFSQSRKACDEGRLWDQENRTSVVADSGAAMHCHRDLLHFWRETKKDTVRKRWDRTSEKIMAPTANDDTYFNINNHSIIYVSRKGKDAT